MMRTKTILTAATLAALSLAAGCAGNKKHDEMADAQSASKYKILNGSTADANAAARATARPSTPPSRR
jgi:uncharacterized membrane protein